MVTNMPVYECVKEKVCLLFAPDPPASLGESHRAPAFVTLQFLNIALTFFFTAVSVSPLTRGQIYY